MGTWGEIERELLDSRPTPDEPPDFDGVRRNYLRLLSEHTGRSTIVYETAGFAPPPGATPDSLQISLDPDVGAFMEVVHGLPRDAGLDLILHSPGGTAEAAEAIVEYLRGRFQEFRVIVPIAAMSAATMISMAADEIVMGAHSQLGPIDPQLTIQTPEGPRNAPAEAIRAQFEEAKTDLAKNPQNTAAWLPILRSYAPALLQLCEDSAELSKAMVRSWLTRYMFNGRADADAKAAEVATHLSDYGTFKSHARRVPREELRSLDLNVTDLEDDQVLQDLVLSVHHAVNHTMNVIGLVKIIENNMGRAFMRRVQRVAIQVPGPQEAVPAPGASRPVASPKPTQPKQPRPKRKRH
jgi:hypothetical protein